MNCKAFHEECRKCGTVGHYKDFCKGGYKSGSGAGKSGAGTPKSKDKGKVNEVKGTEEQSEESDEQGDLGTLTGSCMMMNGSPPAQVPVGGELGPTPGARRRWSLGAVCC